ncbi:DgyrCDS13144 [Dimorphilus gyrociliatus]|uniref:DgyrCDS13144 n=1 Tax=Dimorphilus gyrociliatus TaxID=2664684 RepID=A0A7I8W9S4_9ANNE|nr:DgyrCDS13144 [Dimorphilus gyrociliatus]
MADPIELQNLLADERERIEEHKKNYQILKSQHQRLQDEFNVVQTDFKSSLEESQMMKEKYTQLIEQLRRDLMQRGAELEEAKSQIISKQKLEILKLEFADDYDSPYKRKLIAAEEELEFVRSDLTKLKYDYSFLKSEYEHQTVERERILAEQNFRHDTEVKALRKEKEVLVNRQNKASKIDAEKSMQLQRENTQLNAKLKNLISEIEELRAQKEHVGLQNDQVCRLQQKQLNEHNVNCKALEAEKQTLKGHVESLQKEIRESLDNQNILSSRVHELERENVTYKGKATEAEHLCKVEITNIKMQMLRERGNLERERDRLLNEIEELKTQLEISQHEADSKTQLIVDKEREIVKRVQAAREEEWKKLNEIDNERLQYETKLQEMERRRIDEDNHTANEKQKLEERLRQSEIEKDDLERAVVNLKSKISQIESVTHQVEQERKENSDLKNQLNRLETEFGSYISSEQQLMQDNDELQINIKRLEKEILKIKENAKQDFENLEKKCDQERIVWAEDRSNLLHRLSQTENQLSTSSTELRRMNDLQAKKKHQYSALVSKMKNKLKLYQVKKEELEIERDALKKCIPSEQHNRIKKQLNDLLRRHRDFRHLLLTGNPSETAAEEKQGTSFNSDSALLVGSDRLNSTFLDYEKDLMDIKTRVDELEEAQMKQTIALKQNLVRSISPVLSSTDVEDDKDNGTEKDNVNSEELSSPA